MLYGELLSPVQFQKLIGGKMKPFLMADGKAKCKSCGHDKFKKLVDVDDGENFYLCEKCEVGKPTKYRVIYYAPIKGTDKFKKRYMYTNLLDEPLDSLLKAKNLVHYIKEKIKREGRYFDVRELVKSERQKLYVKGQIPIYMEEQKKRLKFGDLSPGGMRKIERIIRLYIEPIFGDYNITHLDTPLIKREITRARVKTSVAEEISKILSAFLGFAVDQGVITERPKVPRFKKAKTYKHNDFYSLEEQSLVIGNIKNKKHRVAITILAKYSARKSEVEPLTWGDIDFRRETIRFNKHVSVGEVIPGLKSSPDKTLIYPFFMGLKELLMEVGISFDKSALIFGGKSGKLMGKNALWKSWTDSVNQLIHAGKLNKKVDLHRGTRSTTLSALYEKGFSAQELAELYGGDVNTMLKHYAKKEVQNVAHLLQ